MNTFEQKEENFNFWQEWANITDIEKRAIESIIMARKLIIEAIPEDALIAIYIKGSFSRREMNSGSDVDIVPIISENNYQGDVFGVNIPDILPAIVVPLSIEELKNNELATKSETNPDTRAKPDRLLKKLAECELIYGEPLNIDNFPIRSDQEALQDGINSLRNGYIPLYRQGKVSFEALLKEVFWMTELELNIAGVQIEQSFAKIANAVSEPNHIIHQAYELRMNPDKEKEEDFVTNLEKYLKTK